MKLADVIVDHSIYPRDKYSPQLVERYTDAMSSGDEFPPIIVEKGTGRLLDGLHRLKAAQAAGVEVCIEERTVPDGVPAKLYAASFSVRHGQSITTAERKKLAREIVEADESFNTVTLGQYLGVSDRTACSYVGDILARRRASRLAVSARLALLGWKQSDISSAVNVAQGIVSTDLSKIEDLRKQIISMRGEGHSVEDIAQRHGLPIELVHAMVLQDADDAARMEALGIKVQPYDVWQFPSCHDLMGDTHPGRVPGELIAHVLYFFTKPGDLVVDPMVGSGTTLDACLLMGRKCHGFDIDARHERKDVQHHDITTGWPEITKKAKLVFWDPPYFSKKDDGYVDGSVSRLSADDYTKAFAKAFGELKKIAPKATLAFLMSDWNDEASRTGIFVWDYADLLRKAGFTLRRHIQVPLSTQQVHPDIVLKFRERRQLARLERYIIIAD